MKRYFRNILVVFFFAFPSLYAHALVKLITEPADFASSPAWAPLHDQIDHDLRAGVWDDHGILFPLAPAAANALSTTGAVAHREGRAYLQVASKSFSSLPSPLRAQVVENLAWYYRNSGFGTYKVTVDTVENNLNDEPLLQALGIKVKELPRIVPAEQLLSEYAQKWAYKLSDGDGANCWHTSIASINHHWQIARRMLPPEFLCHLRTSFETIDAPSQWGDLIRLSEEGEEVHGFTFLGVDRNDPSRKIVFTKNGYARGYFLFMDFETVTQIYSGTQPSYYRRVRAAIDPKEDASAPCAHPSLDEGGVRFREQADAVIEYGMRKHPTTSFAPMRLN